jgi:hypothetical protein
MLLVKLLKSMMPVWRPGIHRPPRRLALLALEDRQCPSGGYLYVGCFDTNNVLRYDENTGAFVDEFVHKKSGGLIQTMGLMISPLDNNLYVGSGHFASPGQEVGVLRYDGTTGGFLNEFAGTAAGLTSTRGLIYGFDNNLYVTDGNDAHAGAILRFNGITGAPMGEFVPRSSQTLNHPHGLVFGPDHNLYVANAADDDVVRYDGQTGAYLGVFATAIDHGVNNGLDQPNGLTFGPDGNLYVASTAAFNGTRAVLRFQGPNGPAPGKFIDEFVPAGSGGLLEPFALLFGPDGNGDGHQDLYVSNELVGPSFKAKEHTSSVKRYDGVSGAFIDTFVAIDSGGLDNPTFMVFTQTNPRTLAFDDRGGRAAVGNGSASKADTPVLNFILAVDAISPIAVPPSEPQGKFLRADRPLTIIDPSVDVLMRMLGVDKNTGGSDFDQHHDGATDVHDEALINDLTFIGL